jgi:hypothetical protein
VKSEVDRLCQRFPLYADSAMRMERA